MSERTDEIVRELGYEPAKSKSTQPETPDVPQGRDLFQTPNYAVDLLVPFIPKSVEWIWECATGDGKLENRLRFHKYGVIGTDLRRTLYYQSFNFLTDDIDAFSECYGIQVGIDCIITNPPFSLKRKFYEKCIEYKIPFALLIAADYSGWIIKATHDGAEKIIPTRRIDYITPSGLSGANGHTADFHSMWLTWGFNLGRTETFVELSLKEKKENI